MKKVRILIADDHEIMRRGILTMLEPENDFQVVAEAVNGREAVELAEKTKPDVAILDISMPELNGLDAIHQVLRVSPETRILIFSMHETEQLVHGVLQAGARGYLLKSGAARHLIPAIRALSENRPFFSSAISQIVFEEYLAGTTHSPVEDGCHRLTGREREIVRLLCEGKSNKEVAAELNISVKTIESHRATIMRKLELDSFSALVRYAIRHNIVDA